MSKLLLTAGLIAATICVSNARPTFAQDSAVTLQQATISKNIRTSVIQAIGAEAGTVEMATTSNIITVSRINSNMNGSTHEGRNSEAKEIASKVEAGIKDATEFKEVILIRVDYLERSASANESKTVDSIEFRKGPDGVFDFHQS